MSRIDLDNCKGKFLKLRIKLSKQSELSILNEGSNEDLKIRASESISINNAKIKFVIPEDLRIGKVFELPECYLFSFTDKLPNSTLEIKFVNGVSSITDNFHNNSKQRIFLIKDDRNYYLTVTPNQNIYGYLKSDTQELEIAETSQKNNKQETIFVNSKGEIYSKFRLDKVLENITTRKELDDLIDYYNTIFFTQLNLFMPKIQSSNSDYDESVIRITEDLTELYKYYTDKLKSHQVKNVSFAKKSNNSSVKPKNAQGILSKLSNIVNNISDDIKSNKETEAKHKLQEYETEKISNIVKDFNLYRYDLVKMMERPILSDLFDDKVAQFNSHCVSFQLNGTIDIDNNSFYTQWIALQNYADTKSYSNFNDAEKKKLKDASVILTKALDPASTDNERMMCLRSLKKQLEGILPFTEENVEWFKEYTGLKEITM